MDIFDIFEEFGLDSISSDILIEDLDNISDDLEGFKDNQDISLNHNSKTSYNQKQKKEEIEMNNYDYSDYTKYIINKYDLNKKTFSFNYRLNNILNIIIFISLSIFSYINDFSLLVYILFMIVSFIIIDIIFMFIDKFFLQIINIKQLISHKIKLLKFTKLDLSQQNSIIKEKEKELNEWKNQNKYDYYYEEKLDKINKNLEELKNNIKEEKEKDIKIEDSINSKYLKDISYAKTIIEELNKNKDNYPKNIQDKIVKVSNLSNELIEICMKEPSLINMLMKTFNIYLIELMEILNIYVKFDSNNQTDNINKINILFKELILHLKELKNKIQSDSSERFNTDIDLLLESLKDEKRKEINKCIDQE